MDAKEISFLMDCFGSTTIPFYYFRDQYALQLLAYQLGKEGASVSAIKQSAWGFLLDKPILKKMTAQLGANRIDPKIMANHKAEDLLYFDLTFTRWGSYRAHRKDYWYQTTRPGFNLVLQLNFGMIHDLQYYELVEPIEHHPFRWICHPVAENNKLTMAWARIDICLERGEVLIEEIQSDWFGAVDEVYQSIQKLLKIEHKRAKRHHIFRQTKSSPDRLLQYCEEVLPPYRKIWSEAMLSATIDFIRQELGIKKVYYHTYGGGRLLKSCSPPRSLYTKLPRRFGFRQTVEPPQMVKDCRYLKKKLRQSTIQWYYLDLS